MIPAAPPRERLTVCTHFMFKKHIKDTLSVLGEGGVKTLIIHNNNPTEKLGAVGIIFRVLGRRGGLDNPILSSQNILRKISDFRVKKFIKTESPKMVSKRL